MQSRPELPLLAECGLPGIREVRYGVHMCHFYDRREDLVALLVPYFAAGLRSNERCIWITAAPLGAADARRELQGAGVDVQAHLDDGSLILREFSDWYAEAGRLKGVQVAALWLAEEERALAAGYAGIRITGNVTFLSTETWPEFMEYEEVVNRAFAGRRIVTLCTYPADRCAATERLDVAHRHNCVLERPDQGWQILAGQPG